VANKHSSREFVAFTINTNIASLQAQYYLNQTQKFQNQTINEVTSGNGIVNSEDDPSGLAIANSYRSNEAVLTQGIQNANGGLSQLQIADGGLSNISQRNVSSAEAAVNALGTAVSTLDSAQALMGIGEKDFTYAVNLAQSQLTNFQAAESQIRDADLVKESANLTKSQILLQAGVAALAQANSAPQQVLSLLHN
jgi:flagellin-like hook-associated protein FlgL